MLTEAALKRVLATVEETRHGTRNRMALMLSYLAGLRVGEIAALTVKDVIDSEGKVREQIKLAAAITKGGHARVVFVSERLRREIERSWPIRCVSLWRSSTRTLASMERPRIAVAAGSSPSSPIPVSAPRSS